MSTKQTLRKSIFKYFDDNPINERLVNKYARVCKKFKISVKLASYYWIEYKKKENHIFVPKEFFAPANYTEDEVKKILQQDGDNMSVMIKVEHEVKSLSDLLKVCEVDDKVWEVVSWQCKKWDVGAKNNDGVIITKPLFSVNAKFVKTKIENNLSLQKDILLKELFAKSKPINKLPISKTKTKDKKNLLEIALFDMHFGKLAHAEESGEDYDIHIAVKRYNTAISTLLSRVNVNTLSKIVLPIGQDMLNVDNSYGTTTAGTPQDNDSRFYKTVRTVKNVLIETINNLSTIAPVDVVVVPGNHDEQSMFMIGEMLEAYYYKSKNININNLAHLRKYYKFGTCGIMYTHGNKEKHADLGMIFAAENPKLWADTTQRFVKIGHYHHNKKTTTLNTQEFQGFQMQILPSLSGSDAWHTGKGFMSLKQAKAFLYCPTEGLIGEYTYTDK